MLVLAEVTSRSEAITDDGVDLAAIPVTAGDGTTMHRRDCALIAHRDDLQPIVENNTHLTASGSAAGDSVPPPGARDRMTAANVCQRNEDTEGRVAAGAGRGGVTGAPAVCRGAQRAEVASFAPPVADDLLTDVLPG